ncbi:MAG: hypothetical protein IRY97_01375 [Thermomicrobiaceae bacterium]|nr:hypothetical protein [Thermomicrobiaceae bacterium]
MAAQMCPNQRTDGSKDIPDDQYDHQGSYSWGWWTNGVNSAGKRHWRTAPTDAYAAYGLKDNHDMFIIPSKGLVVVWNDTNLYNGTGHTINGALKLLMQAVVSG